MFGQALRSRKDPSEAASTAGSFKSVLTSIDSLIAEAEAAMKQLDNKKKAGSGAPAAALPVDPEMLTPVEKAVDTFKKAGVVDEEVLIKVQNMEQDTVKMIASKKDDARRLVQTFVTFIVEETTEGKMLKALKETSVGKMRAGVNKEATWMLSFPAHPDSRTLFNVDMLLKINGRRPF